LNGHPDLVFRSRKRAIFVHGCFWHQHECGRNLTPKSNSSYWENKLERNAERDRMVLSRLQGQGWKCLVLWECELDDEDQLRKKLLSFIEGK
jgi:DNA mismatch endonuclease (patch repair protein)